MTEEGLVEIEDRTWVATRNDAVGADAIVRLIADDIPALCKALREAWDECNYWQNEANAWSEGDVKDYEPEQDAGPVYGEFTGLLLSQEREPTE